MRISRRELDKIKKNLKKPYSERIAKQVKCSPQLVISVMNGYRKDHHGIIECAIKEAEEYNNRINGIKQSIKKIS